MSSTGWARGPRAAIVGAGGHGRDVRAIMDAAGWQFWGWYDDGFGTAISPAVGADGYRDPEQAIVDGVPLLLAVNDPDVRAALHHRLDAWALHHGQVGPTESGPLVHPSAIVGPGCTVLAHGIVLAALVVLTTDVVLGKHTHLNVGASVNQASTVGEFCTIGPGARICGDVEIGDRCYIGAGAVISNTAQVGDGATVGAGSVVTPGQIVEPGSTVVGVPARAVPARRTLAGA